MQIHDFVAVGLGPFNLGLACLMAPLKDHRGLFLERNERFAWHPGMLLARCTLQNPFLADLVSLADPTSRFSYLNYCKQQGRIYACYVRENFYLTRQDFNRYGQWAAAQLDSVRFGHEVTGITHEPQDGVYRVAGRDLRSGRGFEHAARRLVIGIGASPRLPACCTDGGPYLHSADYLAHKQALQSRRSITIVGSGQSAAEIYRDLLQDIDRHGYSLHWVTRSPRFFQMENAKLALELISPDYAEHFHGLPDASKQRVLDGQKSIYNGINGQLIDALYEQLDERRDELQGRTRLLPNMALHACRRSAEGHELEFVHTELGRRYRHRAEGLIFATGYAPSPPGFIEGIRHRIAWDALGRYRQQRNYAVDLEGREIFVQNAGFHSHGATNPDLGLACHRNACIIRALTGVEHYRVETRTALQDFAPRADGVFEELPA
ncbi:MAG TPA: SidA/IucD/PvdA family monooxygenase [Methylibium sp.]|uniref:lysine N(6)-hydroxylase/L-ornithine N(5)-oxygenase family protein n=1 Tax=Methylibium sp. TaxID=2067992 RepID=UPI002DBE4FAE|nr:SidA/IucD/PvdA family monooxygenase [Methylibium sp.]HEU4460560.1 SidA/IucD/PvdA family monooxygenase [Methylibium sp.]